MESPFSRSPNSRYARYHSIESPTALLEPAWTTARCNRLLRPLLSKITLLRKVRPHDGTRLDTRQDEQSDSDNIQSARDGLLPSLANGKDYTSTGASSSKIHGLDWDPSPRPRKKVKRTYSSREIIHPTKPGTAETHTISLELGSGPSVRIAANFVNVDKPLLPLNILLEYRPRSIEANTVVDKCSRSGYLQSDHPSESTRSREIFRRYTKSAYPEQWRLFDGIHSGFETLLKATSKNLTGNKKGARSLLSICLKKTPEYIAIYERWCRTQDPDSAADISSNIYGELEMTEARFIQSSNALQEVVRAHGVDLIGSAVRDGVICFPVASRIVKLCLRLEAYDEGQAIIDSLLMQKSFPKPRSRDDVMFNKELSILDQFAIVTGRFGFLYRELTMLFENRTLPIGWISSPDMIERWSGVIQCISERNSDAKDAAVLLRTVILMSEGLDSTSMASQVHQLRIRSRSILNKTEEQWPRNRKQDETASSQNHKQYKSDGIEKETAKTGLRLLAALCALEFAQKLAQGPDETVSSVANITVLQDLALEAHQILETYSRHALSTKESTLYADGLSLILLAAGLNSGTGRKDDTALHWYLDIVGCKYLSNEFPSKAASFLSIVASWRGQAQASDGFEYIQEIVQQLLRVSSLDCCPPETRTLVGTIATIAAIQYASIASKPKHLSWALETETRVNGMTVGIKCQTPRRIPKHSVAKTHLGFKWEEGICEWVAGTPGVLKPKPIIYRDVGDAASSSKPPCEFKPPAVTLDSSPCKTPCLGEISPVSARSNGGGRTRSATPGSLTKASQSSLTKTTHGSFLGVEVPHYPPLNIQSARHDLQCRIEKDSPSSSENGMDELSNPESSTQGRPVRHLEELAQTPLQRPRQKRAKKKGMKYGGLTKSHLGRRSREGRGQENRCEGGLVKISGEDPDSEDELSFC
jgi:hypothetical protein